MAYRRSAKKLLPSLVDEKGAAVTGIFRGERRKRVRPFRRAGHSIVSSAENGRHHARELHATLLSFTQALFLIHEWPG